MMSLKFKCLLTVLFALHMSFSQNQDEVLLKVDGTSVMSSEFLRVYNKNLDLVKDESQKDIDGYLKLFIEYQLKLKEARRLKLDEDKKYKREFLSYKKQLTKNYLSENKVTDRLVKEAYDRSGMDIRASHILVRLDEAATDTIATYNEVLALRQRVLNEGFGAVKAEMHDGSTVFLEDLGYFSAFKMVYDFETAAYNTPVGELSMPFRTQFGYHVVNVVEKRPSRGTITVAHIMVGLKQKDSLLDPEQRITDIYKKMNQGESFESLAKQFSDDNSSAINGGKLAPFKSGQLSSVVFEDVAFGLENDGDVSAPFKSEYGWHIVKRIDHEPIQEFEELKNDFESRVKRDSRSKLINSAMVQELKTRYIISIDQEARAYFETLITDAFFTRSWRLPEDFQENKTLFTINDSIYTYQEFGSHLMAAQTAYNGKNRVASLLIHKEFDAFFENSILTYREDNLEFENQDFANILMEYRDGLLLFDLMEKEIWNKASKDTLGLEAYYDKHKSNYNWDDRVEVVMASSADESHMESILKMMEKGKSEEEISKALNKEDKQNVIFTKGIFNTADGKLPSDLEITKGVSKVYAHNEAFHVIDIKAVLPSGTKTLKEAKGSVINDYQSQIEANWLNALHQRYKVEVNQDALDAIKMKIRN